MDKATVIALLRGEACKDCKYLYFANEPYDEAKAHCVLKTEYVGPHRGEFTEKSVIPNFCNHFCYHFRKRPI